MNRREYLKRLEQLLLILPEEEREEALQYYSDYFDDAGIEKEDAVILELGSPEEVAAKVRAGFAGEYAQYSEQGYEDARFQNNHEMMPGYPNTHESADSEWKDSSYKGTNPEWKNSSYEGANSEWKDSVSEAEMQDEAEYGKKKKMKKTDIWKIVAIGFILLIAAPVILPLGIAGIAVVFALVAAVFAVIFGIGVSGFALLFAGIVIIAAGIIKVLSAPALGILAAGIGCILLAIGIVISWVMIMVAVKVVPGVLRGIVNILRTPFRKAGAK